jgi:hypothetical protein
MDDHRYTFESWWGWVSLAAGEGDMAFGGWLRMYLPEGADKWCRV